MAEDVVRRLAGEQRRRFIAGMLGAAETSPWWGRLNVGEQRAFRDKVLATVGTYHDFMLDVIKVSNEDTIRNEHAIELLRSVHDSQRRLEQRAERSAV